MVVCRVDDGLGMHAKNGQGFVGIGNCDLECVALVYRTRATGEVRGKLGEGANRGRGGGCILFEIGRGGFRDGFHCDLFRGLGAEESMWAAMTRAGVRQFVENFVAELTATISRRE